MNKSLISILLIAFLTVFSQAQELDKAYLESLPQSVRDDVLLKIDERDQIDKPVYRRQSTMVDKIDSDIGIAKRFGDNIFDMMQSTFMPINEPNFDSSYVLDFGDTLEIQLIGQKNLTENLEIKRDGSINIPEIGKIFISGLSLDDVSKIIKAKIGEAYIGVEAYITLVNVRDIQVLIAGNAYNPGIYTLNGNSNMLHALTMAGGVNEIGSYRKIDLIRNNKIINSIDLYDFFIHGKSGFVERLRSGDSIVVRPSLKMVSISGAVKRPGLYELRDDNNYLDLLEYANGFSDNANIDTLRVERPYDENTIFIEFSDMKELESTQVQSGDRLNVRAFERKTVTILGAVKTPGTYTISKGETISSLIKKADGYKDNAYPFGGILENKKALALNTIAVKNLYTSYVQKLITKSDALFASESLPFILEELKKSNISGRLIAEFDLDVIKANPELDTTLDDGDILTIPIKTEQVFIFGEVGQPGAVRYNPSQKTDKYIASSGGLLESADTSNIFIIHPNGEVVNLNSSSKLLVLNSKNNEILIYPGSVIYIPRGIKSDPSMVASIWAPIISSAATTITALSILDGK
jgi:polysaccharide biosynthesis/export protein